MPVWNLANGGKGLWDAVKRKVSVERQGRPDRREYTLMFVPHHGKKVFSLRIPIKALKATAVTMGALVIVTAGAFINYERTLSVANVEKVELERLKQVNASQSKQIEQLAKATAVLQEDMNRLNKLDADLRKIVSSDELPPSRSGTPRPSAPGGQGGPTVKPDVNELSELVKDLQATAKAREQSLSALRQQIIDRNARLAATPSIWPTYGDVTSRFGWRGSPWGGWGSDFHPGIDIANDYGTPINATADGTVVYSGWYSGYGYMIQIDHGNGIVTVYGHNSQNLVRVGDFVQKGGTIAYMGSTGNSTGPHCHYEVRVNGTAVNPANFL